MENLKLLARLGLGFITTLKNNRLLSVYKDTAKDTKSAYLHLEEIEWTPQILEEGLLVKLKELPFAVRLFKIVTPNGDLEWLVTNGSDTGQNEAPPRLTAHDVKAKNAVRWHIEQWHRELKPLVGSAKCQCRKARSQRNYLACCSWPGFSSSNAHVKSTPLATRPNINFWSVFLRNCLRIGIEHPPGMG